MAKMKSHRGAMKRFKVTGSGKVTRFVEEKAKESAAFRLYCHFVYPVRFSYFSVKESRFFVGCFFSSRRAVLRRFCRRRRGLPEKYIFFSKRGCKKRKKML